MNCWFEYVWYIIYFITLKIIFIHVCKGFHSQGIIFNRIYKIPYLEYKEDRIR